MTQEPVTKEGVIWAISVRNKAVLQLPPELKNQFLQAKIVCWTEYSINEAVEPEGYEDRMREMGYVTEDETQEGGERLELRGPFNDRFHFYPHANKKETVFGNGKDYTLAWFVVWDKDPPPDGIFVQGTMGAVHSLGNNSVEVKTMPVKWMSGYSPAQGDEHERWLLFILELFLNSRYTLSEKRTPPKPSEDRNATGGNGSQVVAVVCRKPEKVKRAEEEAYRKRIEADGKKWELQHESPVNGFVRNQYYASIGQYRKIVIQPFVRGKGKPQRVKDHVEKAVR
jgi:hypothetical protein